MCVYSKLINEKEREREKKRKKKKRRKKEHYDDLLEAHQSVIVCH